VEDARVRSRCEWLQLVLGMPWIAKVGIECSKNSNALLR
jgi:hypothetical protein